MNRGDNDKDNMDLQASILALQSSLKKERDAFQLRAEQRFADMVTSMGKQLEAAGFDLNIAAPYPSSAASRQAYRYASARRASFSHWFKPTSSTRQPGAPAIVSLRPDYKEELRVHANRATAAYFDAWVCKLAGKIGQPVSSAAVTGDLWESSILVVRLEDGTNQHWRTRCILNVSVLGKVFNQWPTRRIS